MKANTTSAQRIDMVDALRGFAVMAILLRPARRSMASLDVGRKQIRQDKPLYL